MPNSCAVPGCRTNKGGAEFVKSVFNFPRDPLRRAQWEWAVQQLYEPTFSWKKGQKICIRHFEEKFIEKDHKAYRDDGTLLILPRKAVSLEKSAVPTLFDFLPDPVPPTCVRQKPKIRIDNLDVLREQIELHLNDEVEGWTVAYCEVRCALSAYKLHITELLEPEIRFSVTFDNNLTPHVVHPIVSDSDLRELLGCNDDDDEQDLVVDEWSKFMRILRFLDVKSNLPFANAKRKRSPSDDDREILVVEMNNDGCVEVKAHPFLDCPISSE